MKVLTIANRKGGAGKSTCAAHLAVEAARSGLKVILIDMDPQKTLETWWQKRADEDISLLDTSCVELESKISTLSTKGFDLCVIDTPGDVSDNAVAGIKVSDLVVIPSKPTAPDLGAIGRTINLVSEDLVKPFVFVVTQAVTNSKSTFQASSALSSFGPIAPSSISNRVSYQRAMGEGSSAVFSDKGAQEEISSVWEFVKSRLFDLSKTNKKKLVA